MFGLFSSQPEGSGTILFVWVVLLTSWGALVPSCSCWGLLVCTLPSAAFTQVETGRERPLGIGLAWAHGTLCACQFFFLISQPWCESSFAKWLWAFAWDLCARGRDSSWPDTATYWRRSHFQENYKLSFLEIIPWLSEPGLDTQTIWETLGPSINICFIHLFIS